MTMESSLLSIPAEVRLQIYEYYIKTPSPPEKGLARFWTVRPYASCRNIHLKTPHDSLWPGYPTYSSRALRQPEYTGPQCQHPNLHSNLLQTCRQIHREYWPFYASIHSWHFANPLTFANHLLARLPPQRLSDIKHLRLSLSREPLRLGIDGSCWTSDVQQNIRNLGRIWKTYPELQANLEELEIECSGYYYSQHFGGVTNHINTLYQTIVEMLESNDYVIDRGQHINDHLSSNPLEAQSLTDNGRRNAHGDRPKTNRYLIWVTRKETNSPFIVSAKTLLIQIKPMCKRDWDKIPHWKYVFYEYQTENRDQSSRTDGNSLMKLKLKNKFWKLAEAQEISNQASEMEPKTGARVWKVLFEHFDMLSAETWLESIRELRLKQTKAEASRLNRSSRSKSKVTEIRSSMTVEKSGKVSKARKRPKRSKS